MSEKLWYLKQCDLLLRLAADDLTWLEARSRARSFSRGSPIYLPADAADSVLLLASGRVKICNITAEGKQAILAFIEPGELFGELAVFDEGAREEYAEAVEKTTVVLIPGEHFRELMDRHAELSVGVTKLIGLRRRRIERRLKYLLFRSNRERLVSLLLELAETYGRETNDGLLLDIKLSHQDLANVIGSTRETVTVTLGELQTEGRLVLGRRKIVLTDVDQLAESVEAPRPSVPIRRAAGTG
ncbi:MAG: Crp/Fnr family transcriptional regulator [Pirellulales bacterium]|nr:Crp/Fnr family transcriptional regulator [Pirellulales bacterium]